MVPRHTEDRQLATDGGEPDQNAGHGDGAQNQQRQPDQQQRQTPQEGQAPAGQQARGQGGNVNVELDVDPDIVKFSVATFVAFGVGTTLAFFLFGALAPATLNLSLVGGAGAAAALFIGIFLAPVLAIVTGLTAARRQTRPGQEVAVTAGAGAALGFLAMVIVQFVIATVLGGGGGGGGGGLGQILGPAIGYTVGVGLTGAAAGYIGVEL